MRSSLPTLQLPSPSNSVATDKARARLTVHSDSNREFIRCRERGWTRHLGDSLQFTAGGKGRRLLDWRTVDALHDRSQLMGSADGVSQLRGGGGGELPTHRPFGPLRKTCRQVRGAELS